MTMPQDAGDAIIHTYGKGFSTQRHNSFFPADPTYEAKAWELCYESHHGRVKDLALFWNVCGPVIRTEFPDGDNK